MIGDYFDHTYLINLEHRKDRLTLALEECARVGLKPEVFKAVNGLEENVEFNNLLNISSINWNKSAAGLMKTTLNLITDAKKHNYSSVLILEDDIEFHPQINEVLDGCFHEMPEDWEMIQLGCSHRESPVRVGESRRIFRLAEADCLHCYALRDTIFDLMIEEITKMEMQLDWVTMKKIIPRKKSYCIVPNFAYQRAGFSDIRQKEVHYTFLKG